ncbi:MAG: hypothetical protein NEHIOOID_00369 [Holosporales bacterium]
MRKNYLLKSVYLPSVLLLTNLIQAQTYTHNPYRPLDSFRSSIILGEDGELGEGGDAADRTNSVQGTLSAKDLIGRGNVRYTDENHQNSYMWYLEALEIPRLDNKLKAQVLIGLGNARYTDVRHSTQASWYIEVLEIPELDDRLNIQAMIGLGNARYTDDDHEKSYMWYLEALEMPGLDDRLKVQAMIGLGNALSAERKNIEAFKYFKEAYETSDYSLKMRIVSMISNKSDFIQRELVHYKGDDKEGLQQQLDFFLEEASKNNRSYPQRMPDKR